MSGTFVNGHGVCNSVSRVQNNTCCSPAGVSEGSRNDGSSESGNVRNSQTENGLHGDEQRRYVERFEEDLRGFLAVPSRIQRRFGQQHRMLNNTDEFESERLAKRSTSSEADRN